MTRFLFLACVVAGGLFGQITPFPSGGGGGGGGSTTALSVHFDITGGTCSITIGSGTCAVSTTGGYLGGPHVVLTDSYNTTSIARLIEGVQDSSGANWGSGSSTARISDQLPSANSVDITFAGAGPFAGTLTDSLPGMGPTGAPASVAVDTASTGAPGSSATVANVGTSSAAIFHFSVPQGLTGAQDHNISFMVTQTGQMQGNMTAGACTIIGWSLIGDTTGSATIEIDAHANSAPPTTPAAPNTTTDKISASAPMTISAAQTASSGAAGVTTWSKSRAIWDSFAINVTAFSGFGKLNGTVYCQ